MDEKRVEEIISRHNALLDNMTDEQKIAYYKKYGLSVDPNRKVDSVEKYRLFRLMTPSETSGRGLSKTDSQLRRELIKERFRKPGGEKQNKRSVPNKKSTFKKGKKIVNKNGQPSSLFSL